MKKVIILSLMIVSALSVDAQRKRTRTATSQGNVATHLEIGANSSKWTRDDKPGYNGDIEINHNIIAFKPKVGYMVIDNLELGVDFGITNEKYENIDEKNPILSKINTKETSINFGIYAKKYLPLNNWFSFTADANIGLRNGNFSEEITDAGIVITNDENSGNTSGVGGAINFGLAFTPYNAFALQANIAGLGVNSMKKDPNGSNDTENTTNVGFNVERQAFTLDFVWYLGRGLWKK